MNNQEVEEEECVHKKFKWKLLNHIKELEKKEDLIIKMKFDKKI